ncbi:MAG: HEAT repeat domain-containing protein [Kiritimatiellae bacterium]|nr:HEAT repeat domain-containing protein [Kiritimatiellia bacterium]
MKWLVRIAALILVVLALSAAAAEVAIGDSKADVLRVLGRPLGTASRHGNEILLYPDGEVEMTEGRVSAVRLRTDKEPVEPAVPPAEPPAEPEMPAPPAEKPAPAVSPAVPEEATPSLRPDVPQLVNEQLKLLKSALPTKRMEAAIALREYAYAHDYAIPQLIELFGDDAVVAVERRAAPTGILAASDEPDYTTPSKEAQKTLAAFGRRAIGPLREALASQNESVRRDAVAAVNLIEDEQAVPLLLAALKDFDDEVRCTAAEGLVRRRHAAALDVFTALLGGAEEPGLRTRAAQALGTSGDSRAIPALAEAVEQDAEQSVRDAAAAAVLTIGGAQAQEVLVRIAGKGTSGGRQAVVEAITGGHGTHTVALGVLTAASQNPEPEVRAAVMEGLGRTGSGKTIETLKTALCDPEPQVRKAAAVALGLIDEPATVDALLQALNDRDATVRAAAAHALEPKQSEQAAGSLKTLLAGDPDTEVRKAAGSALAALPAYRALIVETALEWLRLPQADLRIAGADLLGGIREKRAIRPLIHMLEYDEDNEARNRAAQALYRITGRLEEDPKRWREWYGVE